MKEYPYILNLPVDWARFQIFDGHPDTGSREYERFYTHRCYWGNAWYTVFSAIRKSGWQVVRRPHDTLCFYRKKEN